MHVPLLHAGPEAAILIPPRQPCWPQACPSQRRHMRACCLMALPGSRLGQAAGAPRSASRCAVRRLSCAHFFGQQQLLRRCALSPCAHLTLCVVSMRTHGQQQLLRRHRSLQHPAYARSCCKGKGDRKGPPACGGPAAKGPCSKGHPIQLRVLASLPRRAPSMSSAHSSAGAKRQGMGSPRGRSHSCVRPWGGSLPRRPPVLSSRSTGSQPPAPV